MHAGRGFTSTTAIAAACLVFSLGVAGCTSIPASPEGAGPASARPLPTVSVTASASMTPIVSTPGTPSVAVPAAPPSTASVSSAPSPTPTRSPPSAPAAIPAPPSASPTEPGSAVEPSPEPGTSAPEPSPTATVVPVDADTSGPAVYYVAIDDGGSRGVRFGCNDSLVPVRGVAVPGDPLTVALGRLLEAGMPVDSDAALYDALAGSSLRYLSGYMSGATVVVNLSGSLRPGGVCDIPRIQAQLTHTIVSASGASRAEIYVNGRTLTEALSVR
ncbi:GerMN domain-containing protein [Arthrobacter sp. AK01]|uniref:GerMN domain-containing protein n=1 Tax=Arthrobacter sp. AK01 TaxID=2894084 RepID=UPI001E3DA18E|nr:GerMN domain-containing protein [Arthrobacter sp. AK01]MCD4852892.1 GerMN domain-containing protein [Arthrobacter sp. AK01]